MSAVAKSFQVGEHIYAPSIPCIGEEPCGKCGTCDTPLKTYTMASEKIIVTGFWCSHCLVLVHTDCVTMTDPFSLICVDCYLGED